MKYDLNDSKYCVSRHLNIFKMSILFKLYVLYHPIKSSTYFFEILEKNTKFFRKNKNMRIAKNCRRKE